MFVGQLAELVLPIYHYRKYLNLKLMSNIWFS